MDLGTPAVLPQAEELLQEAEAMDPLRAELWLAKGRLESARSGGKGATGAASGRDSPQGPRSARERGRRALVQLERALELDPDNGEVILAMSAQLFTLGEHGRAEELVGGLLRRQPDHPQALLRHGEILLASGRPDEGEAALAHCIEAALRDGDPLTAFQAKGALGLAYERQGRLEEAEVLLLQAAADLDSFHAEHPGRTKVNCPHESLARLYVHSGRTEQAARHAMKAADVRAWMPEIQYQAAKALLDAGDLEGARIYLERGKARDLGSGRNRLREDLRRGLEQAGMPAGGFEAALASALRLADLYQLELAAARLAGLDEGKDCVDCQVLAGFLALLDGDATRARSQLEAVSDERPEHLGAGVGMGHLALEGEDHERAMAAFEGALRALDPVQAAANGGMDWMVVKMALLGAAWCHHALGEYQQASEVFARVLAQRPDDIRALLGRGNALNGLGQASLAQELFRRVLLIEPAHPQALAGLGTALYNQGRYELAAALFRGAQRVAPASYSCPFEGLGLVYLAQRKPRMARKQFEAAIAADPGSDYRKYDELARIELESGNRHEAARLLRMSLDNHPAGEEARRMLEQLIGTEGAGSD